VDIPGDQGARHRSDESDLARPGVPEEKIEIHFGKGRWLQMSGFEQIHNHEEDLIAIPATEPANLPSINPIP
jgi:hypothetical protein